MKATLTTDFIFRKPLLPKSATLTTKFVGYFYHRVHVIKATLTIEFIFRRPLLPMSATLPTNFISHFYSNLLQIGLLLPPPPSSPLVVQKPPANRRAASAAAVEIARGPKPPADRLAASAAAVKSAGGPKPPADRLACSSVPRAIPHTFLCAAARAVASQATFVFSLVFCSARSSTHISLLRNSNRCHTGLVCLQLSSGNRVLLRTPAIFFISCSLFRVFFHTQLSAPQLKSLPHRSRFSSVVIWSLGNCPSPDTVHLGGYGLLFCNRSASCAGFRSPRHELF